MTDPLDTPPVDHGSDRQDYIEIQGAPEGIEPSGRWWDRLKYNPCMYCMANIFIRWQPIVVEDGPSNRMNWHVTIAHDEDCDTPMLGPNDDCT